MCAEAVDVGGEGAASGGGQAAVCVPESAEGEDEVSAAALALELGRGVAGAEVDGDAVAVFDFLGLAVGAVDADGADVLFSHADLVEGGQVVGSHGGESAEEIHAGG